MYFSRCRFITKPFCSDSVVAVPLVINHSKRFLPCSSGSSYTRILVAGWCIVRVRVQYVQAVVRPGVFLRAPVVFLYANQTTDHSSTPELFLVWL